MLKCPFRDTASLSSHVSRDELRERERERETEREREREGDRKRTVGAVFGLRDGRARTAREAPNHFLSVSSASTTARGAF